MILRSPRRVRLKHAALVYNPRKARIDAIRRVVADEERRRGWGRSHWYETSGDDSGRSAAEAALAEQPTVIIIIGGDGTVRAVVETVYEHRIPVALIPTGTGNLLARNLGIPLNDVEACVAAAFSGSTRAIDVGLAEIEHEDGRRTRHVFLVMAGIGLDAEMAEHTSALAKKHLGWLAYVSPIARSVLANRLFQLDYRVDRGRIRSTHAHTVIVGNCGTLTGSMLLIPAAVVDDGRLDVVTMRPKGRFEWARIGTRLTVQGISRRSRLSRKMFQGAPDLRALAYAQGEQFEARFDTPRGIELDGDGFGHVVRARISVLPGALNLLVAPEPGAITPSCASLPGG